MGTEIVFVLILPIAAFCLAFAVFRWSRVAASGGRLKAYAPLLAGFAVSMTSLALVTYIECYEDFTSLVQQGYYSEAQRAVYLPGRFVGQAIVALVFLLPAISFVVVPLTARLVTTERLTFKRIGALAIALWLSLSVIGWLFSLVTLSPPYPLASFLVFTAIPVLLYGLPIPLAAIFFRLRAPRDTH